MENLYLLVEKGEVVLVEEILVYLRSKINLLFIIFYNILLDYTGRCLYNKDNF